MHSSKRAVEAFVPSFSSCAAEGVEFINKFLAIGDFIAILCFVESYSMLFDRKHGN